MTGSPSIFPQLKIPNMLVEHGASLVADEFCSSNRLLYDSAAVAEWQLHDMIPALADKYLKPNTCPVFVPNDSVEINSTCAVFAESEIISLLAEETSIGEIVVGLHNSIAKRIRRLSRKIKFQTPILFDGGTALNKGLKQALEEEFMTEITVSNTPEITSAIGAAIYSLYSSR